MQKHILSAFTLLTIVSICSAQQNRHDRIMVVPAPRPVVVDGNLQEWDLSGSIECVFDEKLRPLFMVRVAVMYDAKALYIGAHFVDSTPLLNKHDPDVEPDRGWAGDCLQVRLCSDPSKGYPLTADTNSDQVCHLTMWHFSDKQMPLLRMDYGMDYHGTQVFRGKDAGVAFQKDKDGNGYTVEARIPWERLHAPRPLKAGDKIAFVVQPLWSNHTGWKQVTSFNDVIRNAGFSYQNPAMWGEAVFLAKGNLQPAERPRTVAEQLLPLTTELPIPDKSARRISAAVYDSRGVMVRSLLAGVELRRPGSTVSGAKVKSFSTTMLQVVWDGLDDDGRALPPGKYSVKVQTHRGIGQKWITSFHTAGHPPWVTDDGTGSWGGDHGPPIAAASDDNQVYLGWTVSEAGWSIIACRSDGQKRWGQHQVLDIGIFVTGLASDGKVVYVAQDGKGWGAGDKDANKAGVVCFDAESGKPVNFPFGKRVLLISEWLDSLKPADLQPFERLSIYHPLVAKKRPWERFRDHDFGPQQHGFNLLGIAVSQGMLYASRYLEDRVTAFDIATGNKVREWEIPKPAGIAASKQGNVFVISDRRVVQLLAGGGTAEVVSAGLTAPHGLALDAEGNLLVTDCGTAMQVKVFDTQGKMLRCIGKPRGRPWIGKYDSAGMLMPTGITVDNEGNVWVCECDDTPRRVSVWRNDGTLVMDLLGPGGYAVMTSVDPLNPRYANVHHTLFELGYEKASSRPVSTLIRAQMQGLEFTPDGLRDLHFRRVQGQTYAVHMGRGAVVIYRVTTGPEGMIARPVCALGPASALPLHGFVHQDFPEKVRDEVWRNSYAYHFQWSDRNGDSLVQNDEWTFTKIETTPAKVGWGLYWGSWVDEAMTIWTATPYGRGYIFKLPVKEWHDGIPIYPNLNEVRPSLEALGKDVVHSVMTDGAGAIYVLEQLGGESYGGGSQWRAVSRYSETGERQWAYRRTWSGFGLESPLATPGDVIGAMKFIGNVKLDSGERLIAVNGYFGQFNLLDSDGLWVASLCKDNRYGPKADQNTVWPENFSGFFFRNTENGKVYLMAGDTDARVWEVTGLDTLRSARGIITITAKDRDLAEKALLKKHIAEVARTTLRLVRVTTPPKVDGGLQDWDMKKAIRLDAGGGRSAQIALTHDDQNLYAAFQVEDPSPMANSGKDFALLFKSGDTCEVMLATDPNADPKRTKPAAGDCRILFSVLEGKPVAVLYMPIVVGGEKAPRTFSSPNQSELFDRVVVLENAHVAIQRTGTGYALEVSVPFAAMGYAPKPGMATKGDVGVLFSDEGGNRTVLRSYFFNKKTGVVNDIPTEARLQPGEWGKVVVE